MIDHPPTHGRSSPEEIGQISEILAAGSERMRLIVVRGFPGQERDGELVCTDPSMRLSQMVELYCKR